MPSTAALMLEYLRRGFARPRQQRAAAGELGLQRRRAAYDHDPARARQLLEQAGYPAVNGVRFHLTMKTSTEESTRLMAAVLQQQLRQVGIALDIRTFEFATFFADVTHGAVPALFPALDRRQRRSRHFRICVSLLQVPSQRRQPRLLSNPRVDALIDQARHGTRPEHAQTALCRNPAHPGRRTALHQSLVFRQRAGAFQASREPHAESLRQLRFSENGRTGCRRRTSRLSVVHYMHVASLLTTDDRRLTTS